jgi:cell division protein ZipA
MDKELFRLILLVFGVTLVATVYYWDRLRGLFGRRAEPSRTTPRKPPAATGEPRREPTVTTPEQPAGEESFDEELVELEALIRADEPADVLLGESAGDAPDEEDAVQREMPIETAPESPPKVLALTLIATGGSISGIRLRRVLTDHGLGLGSRGLFERIGEEGRPLFSAANLVEPGTFDPATLDGLSTPGLVLFQVLDGPGEHATTFDAMLETATRLAERLDCELCDTERRRVGRETIAALREEAVEVDA